MIHDVGRPVPVAFGGRPHELPLDQLGEAHDRVQRRAQLMDQLAQRIGRQAGPKAPAARGCLRPPRRAAPR